MKLELIRLQSDSKDRAYFEEVNREAFPPSERLEMDEIFAFAQDTDTDILGIYDEKTPIGFAVLLKNAECAYIYYIAIDKNLRSKGYGGAALGELMEAYSDLQLSLDFEELKEEAENIEQRIRRKNFYLRNGFHETGNYTLLCGERFEVVCNKGELQKPAFKELLKILHAHRPEFPDVLL